MNQSIPVYILAFCLLSLSCKKTINEGDSGQQHDYVQDTIAINALQRYGAAIIMKNPDSAILIFNRNLRHATSIQYTDGVGNAYLGIGRANFFKYLYDTALYYDSKAFDVYTKTGNKTGMAQAAYGMSYDYSLKQDMQKSLAFAEKAKMLYEETGYYTGVYQCMEVLIYLNKHLQRPEIVDSLIHELVAAAERTGNRKYLANSYYNLGSYYIDQAYVSLAIEPFFKALQIAEEVGDSTEIANALGSIGLANIYLQEYEKAIGYFLKQEEILRGLGDRYELSRTYSNLGEAYNALKSYETGLAYHRKALAIRGEINHRISLSYSLYNIGYTYYLMGDSMDKALEFVRQSLEMDRQIGNAEGLAKNNMLTGKIYAQSGKIPSAIRYLEQGLALAQKYNVGSVVLEASESLSTLYERTGNMEKAYRSVLLYHAINDSLTSGANYKRITQLEMQHSFDKRQNELEVAHVQERMALETKLRRNRMIRNFSLLLGIVVVAFGIFMFYSYRKSRRADKEKEALLKEIHHRVKNNLMVISSLLNLQSGSITDDNTRSAVRESQSRVKSMALIHQLLYQSEMFTRIDFPRYLEQLMASLQSTYSSPGKNIKYVIQAEDIRLDIDTAIPLGLIVNELATNAYKYAFVDSTDGTIAVDLSRTEDHKYMLRVSDDGRGLPRDFDLENSTTLGLKLVRILSKQIRARLDYRTGKGAEFNVVFAETI